MKEHLRERTSADDENTANGWLEDDKQHSTTESVLWRKAGTSAVA